MEDMKYPKQFLDYWPTGRWRPWRPLKRLPDTKSWGRSRSFI